MAKKRTAGTRVPAKKKTKNLGWKVLCGFLGIVIFAAGIGNAVAWSRLNKLAKELEQTTATIEIENENISNITLGG